jgi:hypothetical protein
MLTGQLQLEWVADVEVAVVAIAPNARVTDVVSLVDVVAALNKVDAHSAKLIQLSYL